MHVSLNEAEFSSTSLSPKPPLDHSNHFSPSPTIFPLHTNITPTVTVTSEDATSNANPTLETSYLDIPSLFVDTFALITSLPIIALQPSPSMDPFPSSAQRTHPMVTRDMNHIHKTKKFFTACCYPFFYPIFEKKNQNIEKKNNKNLKNICF
jgi:hypothetical protein